MIILSIILIITTFFLNKKIKLKQQNNPKSISFLIPARDESKVIENLLKSIINQTIKINSSDIYVIVEDKNDPTISICNKYNVSVIIRKNLDLKTKGYALDDGLKQIKKKYDLYFIMDADNVLDSKFVEEMLKNYREGYDIATGYRNVKNGNDSLVSSASGVTFSLLNNILNKSRIKNNIPVLLSGTGFYIKGKIINNFNGYPFNSLTEDYELSLYSILNKYKTTYNDKAIFYDEQPVNYKNTINQRKRWIKGYFTNRFKYIPLLKQSYKNNKDVAILNELIGIKPYLMLIIGVLIWMIYFICNKMWLQIGIIFISIYIALMLVTLFGLINDKKINLSFKRKFQMIFFNPLYLISFVHIAILVLIDRNITWEPVEHSRNIDNITDK